jgi:hypothetical protein
LFDTWSVNQADSRCVLFSFSDTTDEWQQAEILMSNYKDMLEKREELQNEVKQLADRSDSLEEELRARLSDEVNEVLAFPPSDTISVGDEEKK